MNDYNLTSFNLKQYWFHIVMFLAFYALLTWLIGIFTATFTAWFFIIGLAAYEKKSIAFASMIVGLTVAAPLLWLKFMTPVEYPF